MFSDNNDPIPGPSSQSGYNDPPATSKSFNSNGMMRTASSSSTSLITPKRSGKGSKPALVGLGLDAPEDDWAELSPFEHSHNNSQTSVNSRRPSAISITDYAQDSGLDWQDSPSVSMGSPLLSTAGGWSQGTPSRPTSPRPSNHLDPGGYPSRRPSAHQNGSHHSSTGSASSFHSSIAIQPTPNLSSPNSPALGKVHNRQVSLTAACLPATASYTPSGTSTKFDAILEDHGRSSPVPGYGSPPLGHNSSDRKRGWKPFNWMGAEVQEKSLRPKPSNSRSFLCLPYNLVSLLLGPFSSLLLPPQTSNKSNSVSSIPQPEKKHSLPLRLFSVFYVCFSLLYLSSKVIDTTLGSATAEASHRLIPRTASYRPQVAIGDWAEGWVKGVREKAAAVNNMWETTEEGEELIEESVDGVSRKWVAPGTSKVPSNNPLTSLTHPYRFSKMHSKMHSGHHDGIEPFAFRAQNMESKGDVTACLYTNEAWLEELPSFVERWNGPVSLVFESLHAQDSLQRVEVLNRIRTLRSQEPLVHQLVDFHFLSNPPTSDLAANRSRERLLLNPVASNFHLNIARFFSRTDMVWLVGDARITPSVGLRKKLNAVSVRKVLITDGDALVVPTFGALRRSPEGSTIGLPSLKELRAGADLDQAPAGGVTEEEFPYLGSIYAEAHRATLPISMSNWPKKKATLVGLASAHPPASVVGPGEAAPTSPVFALFDQAWDPNRGPSNWALWRKGSLDPRLAESAEQGGGAGLGLSGGIGGGQSIYKVVDYELHYAPNVVISRDAQPWCTERFDLNKAACVYQMFLSGAGMWVLPDEWAFTLESLDKADKPKGSEADKLKNSISSRLYTKFHAEACMHYGREFLSLNLWESKKAANLRSTCARVLSSWGVGTADADK